MTRSQYRYGAWVPQGFLRELRGVPQKDHIDIMVRISRRAEEAGFDALWVGDHLHSGINGENDPIYESWLVLAMVSQHTSRVRLGHLVVANTFRPPGLVAKMAATLDGLSGGRFDLAIGASWHEEEHHGYGIPFPPAGERIAMLSEAIDIIRLMWAEGHATYAGRHYQLAGGQCDPKPAQPRPRLLVGGVGRNMLRVVAEKADRWNYYGPYDQFVQCIQVLEAHCADLGRDPGEIERSWFPAGVILRETTKDAAAVAARLKQERHLPRMLTALHGTPVWFMTKMRMYAEHGVTEFMPQFGDYPDTTSLDLFAERVIPYFEG